MTKDARRVIILVGIINMNECKSTILVILKIVCVVAMLTIVAAVFFPACSVVSVRNNKKANTYKTTDVIVGGLYDKKNDKFVHDETGYYYVKYEKMSENARSFYDTMVYVPEGKIGRATAVVALLAVVFGGVAAVINGLSGFFKDKRFANVLCLVANCVAASLAVVQVFLINGLTSCVQNPSAPNLNFSVVPSAYLVVAAVVGVVGAAVLATSLIVFREKKC